MSAPDDVTLAPALRFQVSPADIVEASARRGRRRDVVYAARARDLILPDMGAATWSETFVTASTRPDRWWIIAAPRPTAETAARIGSLLGTGAIVVDQSSGFEAIDLHGVDWREALTRGCRLDLDPRVFVPGSAAATVIAQVPVVLIAHPSGLLTLVQTTFSRHFREWLQSIAAPRGAVPTHSE